MFRSRAGEDIIKLGIRGMNGSAIAERGARLCRAVASVFERLPWIGWAGWAIFCVIALANAHPRRFGATFKVYLDYSHRLWSGDALYDPARIDAYLYWPISLVILRPFLNLDPVTAAPQRGHDLLSSMLRSGDAKLFKLE